MKSLSSSTKKHYHVFLFAVTLLTWIGTRQEQSKFEAGHAYSTASSPRIRSSLASKSGTPASIWPMPKLVHGSTNNSRIGKQLFNESAANSSVTTTPHRLILVYHVGPGKMGSSAIQYYLKKSTDILRKDTWVYYDYVKLAALNACLTKGTCVNNEQEEFSQFLQNAQDAEYNVILSTEMWYGNDSVVLPAYKRMFEATPAYDVKIVVAYRRLFELLPSFYYQFYRWSCPHLIQESWTDESKELRGGPIPPLSEYIQSPIGMSTTEHPTITKLRRFSAHFDSVTLFNIHEGDVVETFFCNVVKTNRTCKGIRESSEKKVANKGHTLFFDRLAQEAIAQGLVTGRNCSEVSGRLEKYSEIVQRGYGGTTDLSSFPLQCPTPLVMDGILNSSLAAETTLFPQLNSSVDHTLAFEKARNSSAFCDVEAAALFANDAWKTQIAAVNASL